MPPRSWSSPIPRSAEAIRRSFAVNSSTRLLAKSYAALRQSACGRPPAACSAGSRSPSATNAGRATLPTDERLAAFEEERRRSATGGIVLPVWPVSDDRRIAGELAAADESARAVERQHLLPDGMDMRLPSRHQSAAELLAGGSRQPQRVPRAAIQADRNSPRVRPPHREGTVRCARLGRTRRHQSVGLHRAGLGNWAGRFIQPAASGWPTISGSTTSSPATKRFWHNARIRRSRRPRSSSSITWLQDPKTGYLFTGPACLAGKFVSRSRRRGVLRGHGTGADTVLVRELFNACIESSRILGV